MEITSCRLKLQMTHTYNTWALKTSANGVSNIFEVLLTRDAGAIAGKGGQQERKGTEDHIQQIFIILLSNHVLLLFLGTGFVLIRE